MENNIIERDEKRKRIWRLGFFTLFDIVSMSIGYSPMGYIFINILCVIFFE